jgi:hypothetical protein
LILLNRAARLVLRRIVGPVTMWDDTDSPGLDTVEAAPKVELLDGFGTFLGTSPRATY